MEGNNKTYYGTLASAIRPYSRSPYPAWGVAALLLSSSILPPNPQRFAFSAIFFGAGYVLSQGDARNGSGIATAWSLTYLFFNFRKSLTTLRGPMSIALTGVTLASSALYGSEYFLLQESEV